MSKDLAKTFLNIIRIDFRHYKWQKCLRDKKILTEIDPEIFKFDKSAGISVKLKFRDFFNQIGTKIF